MSLVKFKSKIVFIRLVSYVIVHNGFRVDLLKNSHMNGFKDFHLDLMQLLHGFTSILYLLSLKMNKPYKCLFEIM